MPEQRYGVYFDESAKNGVYVFTAAVVKASAKRALERRLLAIRKEMTREVLRAVPQLSTHSKLADGRLLEIHAVDLYQSSGVFREVKRAVPDFWHQQHEWLRQTLEVAHGYGVTYLTMANTEGRLNQSIQKFGLPSELFPDYRFRSVIARFDSVFKNPYFVSLLGTMHQVNEFLKAKGGVGDLYCHTYDDAHSYSVLESYDIVRTRGHFEHLERPVFRTCSQEQGIQCADAAGYVWLQVHSSIQNGTPLKPEFQEWGQRYVHPNWRSDLPLPTDEDYEVLGLILFETFAANPAGPTAYQRIVRRLMAEHLRAGVNREPHMQNFLLRALELYDQTNKPPAEAEDLYDDSLPHVPNGDKDMGDLL